jgi:cytochrome c553
MRMIELKRATVLAAALVFASPLLAQPIGDPQAGAEKAQACFACHGENGVSSNPAWPKLAGQYADYLLQALKAYKSGDRENAIMAGQVANLSEQDMADLAAYFAAQPSALFTPER